LDLNHRSLYRYPCFGYACAYNPNILIPKYLVEHTDAKFDFNSVSCERWKNIVKIITMNLCRSGITFGRFNEFMTLGFDHYGSFRYHDIDLIIIAGKLNPLLIPRQYLGKHFIPDPFDDVIKYEDFVKHVDDLIFQIPIPLKQDSVKQESVKQESVKQESVLEQVTQSQFQSNDLLFNYNGETYYGSREIVYNSIICLSEIYDIANFDDPVTLSGCAPRYIVDLWLRSMGNNKFNLMEVMPTDLINFLKLIDMYPTHSLGIQLIEQDLIQYIDQIDFLMFSQSDIWYMKDVMKRYRLKRLYLSLHNKMLSGNPHDEID